MRYQMSNPLESQTKLESLLEQYINLPRIVHAVQINHDFALKCMDGKVKLPENMRVYQCARVGDQIKDFVIEFKMRASEGGVGTLHASFNDWIVRGTAGEWYPINAEIFAYKYAKHQLMNAEAPYYNG